MDHGFEMPWVRLVCTSVEFVLSIVIKSVVIYNHLYERRVCSFDRNQMVQIQFAFYVERACNSLACSDGHKILNLNLLGDCSLHMYKFRISFMRDQAGHRRL